MTDSAKGIVAMVAACVIWGLSPIFYKLLADVPPLEVLSHRTLWALLIFGGVLAVQGRFTVLLGLLRMPRSFVLVLVAGLLIALNWFVFILSIQIDRAVEASLGYFIFPLVAVVLGRIFFGERLNRLRWISVIIVGLAVAVLTFGLKVAPLIPLVLAVSFAFYGVIKKHLAAGPVVSVTGEVLLLAPLAAVWLLGVHFGGWQGLVGRNMAVFGHDLYLSLLLALSGVMTASPLMLFSYASRRLPMASVGLLQYINPSLQFLVATVIFGEILTIWHIIAFPMIWAALALYSVDLLRQERRAARVSKRVGTSGIVVK